ncbi:MAG: hypothetical protein DDT25_00635 [Chloroflexi bacterium]|nr:hypothetical protein [Chloroflexota bacterium]
MLGKQVRKPNGWCGWIFGHLYSLLPIDHTDAITNLPTQPQPEHVPEGTNRVCQGFELMIRELSHC